MAGFGVQCRKRLEELRKAGANVPTIIAEAAEEGTIQAVEAAVKGTPPNVNGLKGTNTRTGSLAQSWQTDSITQPIGFTFSGGSTAVTMLKSNLQYASYVNDGHRVDKHYVPGLVPNGGLLEMVDPEMGGIVVGTKTTYVPGLYMVDKAKGAYKTTVRRILQQKVRELLK